MTARYRLLATLASVALGTATAGPGTALASIGSINDSIGAVEIVASQDAADLQDYILNSDYGSLALGQLLQLNGVSGTASNSEMLIRLAQASCIGDNCNLSRIPGFIGTGGNGGNGGGGDY